MWKLHRKLNFPNIFRLAAIYTWAPAFKSFCVQYHPRSISEVAASREVRGSGRGGRNKLQKVRCMGWIGHKILIKWTELGKRKTFPVYLKLTSYYKFLYLKNNDILRERERERKNDRSQTADAHSNAQSPVYIWKTGLALFRLFTCCLGVYTEIVFS